VTTHRLSCWVALAAGVFVLEACGGSEAGSSSDGGGGGSDSASYRDTRATVPVVELNETGPSAQTPTGPVMCSGKMCSAASGGMIPLVACCLSDNTCGLTFDLSMFGGAIPGGGGDAGVPCLDTAPGTPDPNCPSQSMSGFSMPGCCSSRIVRCRSLDVVEWRHRMQLAAATPGPRNGATDGRPSTIMHGRRRRRERPFGGCQCGCNARVSRILWSEAVS